MSNQKCIEGKDIRALKLFELRLLRCSLTPYTTLPWDEPEDDKNAWFKAINTIVSNIEKGEYKEALSSDAARLIFGHIDFSGFQNTRHHAEKFYRFLEDRLSEFLNCRTEETWLHVISSEDDRDTLFRAMLVFVLGLAAFFVFVQRNVTGPCIDFQKFPLSHHSVEESMAMNEFSEWDLWANQHLMCDGCDLLGKCALSQYFILAHISLNKVGYATANSSNKCSDSLKTFSWWASRLLLIQQKVLDERSSSLHEQLNLTVERTLMNFGEPTQVSEYWEESLLPQEVADIVAAVNLEAGIKELVYGHVDKARKYFEDSKAACSLKLSVTGMLGFRTIYQQEPKAQMVLVAECLKAENHNQDRVCSEMSLGAKEKGIYKGCGISAHHVNQYEDGNDILLAPKLVENKESSITIDSSNSDGNSTALNAMSQAIILAESLHIKKNTPDDELQDWEMAPYIEAVDAQNVSYFMIRSSCQILRIRWEYKRGRTKQRAIEMIDGLVQDIHMGSARVADHMHYAYCVYFPTISELLKEYAEMMLSLGIIGNALQIFEELELWDNVIYCYCLLGKKPAAIDLIKERLKHNLEDPRLWCSLGDVTSNDDNYVKALEVSNRHFARAERSLAHSAYNRGDYKKSQCHWEAALALNSLHPDGWFALGAAALKAKDLEKAVDAFTHAVQLDPDNGEAWNNIACLHMMKMKHKEAFIAFREALKFRRNSWQMWENYSQVAMNIGNFGQALEAMKKVLDLTNSKRFNINLLSTILDEMESRNSQTEAENSTSWRALMEQKGNGNAMSSFEREQIVEMLGQILQQIVRSGESKGEIWGLYARWHKYNGNSTSYLEALLKQVRAYQGSSVVHDEEQFKRFASSSAELCEHYVQIATCSGSKRELNAAQMHLRNAIKLGNSYSGLDEFKRLDACLRTVNTMLESQT